MSESQLRHGLTEGSTLRRLLAASGVALMLVVGQGSGISAQDATPAATTCDAPTLPPGTPTPMMEGSPEAMVMGSPEAMATEAAAPEGEPADDATAAEITSAVENYAACYNSGDPANYVALWSENYLMTSYGTNNPYDAVAGESGFPLTAELVSVSNQMTYADGRVSADIELILGGHWFQNVRDFFVQDGDYWKLDEEIVMAPEPDGDTAVVGVALGSADDEYSLTPNAPSVVQPEVLIFNATNGGQELHELVVVQLPEGADPMGLLDGSVGMDQIQFFGGVFGIAPGDTQDLALVNLEPGVYTLLCFFPSPDGVPHAALGMIATFEVTAATS